MVGDKIVCSDDSGRGLESLFLGDAGVEVNDISTERRDSVSLSPMTCSESSKAYAASAVLPSRPAMWALVVGMVMAEEGKTKPS